MDRSKQQRHDYSLELIIVFADGATKAISSFKGVVGLFYIKNYFLETRSKEKDADGGTYRAAKRVYLSKEFLSVDSVAREKKISKWEYSPMRYGGMTSCHQKDMKAKFPPESLERIKQLIDESQKYIPLLDLPIYSEYEKECMSKEDFIGTVESIKQPTIAEVESSKQPTIGKVSTKVLPSRQYAVTASHLVDDIKKVSLSTSSSENNSKAKDKTRDILKSDTSLSR